VLGDVRLFPPFSPFSETLSLMPNERLQSPPPPFISFLLQEDFPMSSYVRDFFFLRGSFPMLSPTFFTLSKQEIDFILQTPALAFLSSLFSFSVFGLLSFSRPGTPFLLVFFPRNTPVSLPPRFLDPPPSYFIRAFSSFFSEIDFLSLFLLKPLLFVGVVLSPFFLSVRADFLPIWYIGQKLFS